MLIKALQIIGNLIPVSMTILAYFVFGDIEPNTPRYAGAAMVTMWIGIYLFAIGSPFLFVIPSSLILLKTENRHYFSFNSKGWLSVLVINWFFIGLYCLCFLVFALTSVR